MCKKAAVAMLHQHSGININIVLKLHQARQLEALSLDNPACRQMAKTIDGTPPDNIRKQRKEKEKRVMTKNSQKYSYLCPLFE